MSLKNPGKIGKRIGIKSNVKMKKTGKILTMTIMTTTTTKTTTTMKKSSRKASMTTIKNVFSIKNGTLNALL